LKILIDTNIFLEVLLKRKHCEEAKRVFDLIKQGKLNGLATSFSVHAVCAIINNPVSSEKFLATLEASGINIYETTRDDEMSSCIVAEKEGLDFDDGLQYFVAKKTGAEAILSFDKHFEGKDLKRVEPAFLVL
jgi:hypothetical protein